MLPPRKRRPQVSLSCEQTKGQAKLSPATSLMPTTDRLVRLDHHRRRPPTIGALPGPLIWTQNARSRGKLQIRSATRRHGQDNDGQHDPRPCYERSLQQAEASAEKPLHATPRCFAAAEGWSRTGRERRSTTAYKLRPPQDTVPLSPKDAAPPGRSAAGRSAPMRLPIG